ncbi:MAG: L,D-transpeptidase [Candidatus Schekmanbacteria bacterium]|nr:L,D-transpeptidase [Candidatus Schekmanbacteria bacterium]
MVKKVLKIFLIVFGFVFLAFAGIEGYGYYLCSKYSVTSGSELLSTMEGKSLDDVQKENSAILKKITTLAPKGTYIVIDTGRNRLYLRKGNEQTREAIVSCGSGNVLQDPTGKKKWIFDTPRGEYAVKTKQENPVWIKPDWAFYEEGEPPPKNYNDRIEEGSLGAYALGFGNGYFIHGTLYTRLLGRNVSHGCVRVGDEDIKATYMASPPGTKIYIF